MNWSNLGHRIADMQPPKMQQSRRYELASPESLPMVHTIACLWINPIWWKQTSSSILSFSLIFWDITLASLDLSWLWSVNTHSRHSDFDPTMIWPVLPWSNQYLTKTWPWSDYEFTWGDVYKTPASTDNIFWKVSKNGITGKGAPPLPLTEFSVTGIFEPFLSMTQQ